MLSSFSRIKLPTEFLTTKPLKLSELLINGLSCEDVMRFYGNQDDHYSALFGNDYYCRAVLKLSTSISGSFESVVNYIHFEFKSEPESVYSQAFWLKCQVIFDENCRVSELCLSELALHNLRLAKNIKLFNVKISEFPIYLKSKNVNLTVEKRLFPVVNQIVIQPVTPFPDCIKNDQIDSAIHDYFKSLKYPIPLRINHQLIIPIDCVSEFQFAAVFSITKVVPESIEQFILGDDSEVFLKFQFLYQKLPIGLQFNLSHSFIFPRTHTFKSFPKSEALNNFLLPDRFGDNALSTILIQGSAGSGKRTLIRRLADDLGVPLFILDLYNEIEFPENNQTMISLLLSKFKDYNNVLLEGFELLNEDLKLRSIWSKISREFPQRNLKLICCHSSLNTRSISEYMAGSFDIVENIKTFSRAANKQQLINEFFELVPEAVYLFNENDFIGYSISDFSDLYEKIHEHLEANFCNSKSNCNSDSKTCLNSIVEDFKSQLKLRHSLQLNTLEIPKVTWDQVAGLDEVKIILRELMEKKISKKPNTSGILLHGPPGTGKTLIAKALATQSQFALLPIKGPELLSPYIGESELALRTVFSDAKAMSPCIIFFDELDALVPRRGEFGDSVGVSDRMVATFMTEMDKINSFNKRTEDNLMVFVIGATNRPDLIDSALLRKGRFDSSILLDAPKTIEEQAAVLAASCSNLNLEIGINFVIPFDNIRDRKNLTPAQIASIATNAGRIVLERKLEKFKFSEQNSGLSSEVNQSDLLIDPITTNDLKVSAEELFNK